MGGGTPKQTSVQAQAPTADYSKVARVYNNVMASSATAAATKKQTSGGSSQSFVQIERKQIMG